MSRYVETPYAALMLDEIEDYEELIEELTEFIDAGGQIGAALHNRSVAQWEIGRSDEALAGFDQATLALPTSPMPVKVKGMMLHKLGRLPEALAALDRAIAIAPEDVTILRTRAAIRADAGMLIEAIADLDCAVLLQPEFKFSIPIELFQHLGWEDAQAELAQLPAFVEAGSARLTVTSFPPNEEAPYCTIHSLYTMAPGLPRLL